MILDETKGTINTVLSNCDTETLRVITSLRRMISELDEYGYECPRDGDKAISYQIGPKKMIHGYCYIMPTKQGLNLGFYQGANLNNEYECLEGTGKSLRHIKIKKNETNIDKFSSIIKKSIELRRKS